MPIGIEELFLTHGTLSDYVRRRVHQLDEVKNALFRLMVVIPEAVRFPTWRCQVLAVLRHGASEVVDRMGHFSLFFNDWSSMSKAVLAGRAKFKPSTLFPTYSKLLASITFILPVKR